jgi:hypothetical protein
MRAHHAQETQTALIFFAVSWSLALVWYVLKTGYLPRVASFWWLKALFSVGLLLGSVFLVSAAHRGFQLVYLQGAGVKAPSTLCVPSKLESAPAN